MIEQVQLNVYNIINYGNLGRRRCEKKNNYRTEEKQKRVGISLATTFYITGKIMTHQYLSYDTLTVFTKDLRSWSSPMVQRSSEWGYPTT